MAKNKTFTTVVNMAGTVDTSVKKGFDEVEKRLKGLDKAALTVTASMAAVGAGIAAAGVKAGKYMLDLGTDFNKSMNKLQAQTGATVLEMEELSDIAKEIYQGNFGESMEDVAASLAEIKKTTQLMGDDLQGVTEGAITLRDTFGYDVTESARAAKAMMTNFGISGEEALSMIAAGAQNGLDYSGELIDSINEYSVQFKKLGFTADDMFNIFQQGADSGAWNLDKVGDAIKEFSIRSIDGSKTTIDAYEQLGYSAEEVMGIFAEGGEDASDAFQILLKDLMKVDDKVKRDAIGVQLFGTMWEDLGTEAIEALTKVDGGLYDTNEALKGIQEVQFDDFDSALQGIGRQIETSLIPASEGFANRIQERFPQIQETVQGMIPHIEDLAVKFADVLVAGIDAASDAVKWLSENSDTLIPILKGVGAAVAAFSTVKMVAGIYSAVTAFKALGLAHLKEKAETMYLMALYAKDAVVKGVSTAATWAQTAATTALSGAMAFLTSPIGLVIIAITALVAAGIWLYKNWDLVKEKAVQLGQFLSGVWDNIKMSVGNLIAGIKETFVSGFSALAGLLKAPINAVIGLINGAINGINAIGFDIPDWVPKIGGKKFSVNIPNLPMLASGGFTDGVSIAGEAGTEAVISFDKAVRSQNLAYWAKAGQMLGALPDNASVLGGGGGGGATIGQITFAPKIEITGNADKESIMKAIEAEYPEFIDLLERWFAERGYFGYEYS